MAASSANDSAPIRLNRPPTTQTDSAAPGVPTSRVISAGTMKIAVPIMMPITIELVSHRPSARSSCGGPFEASAEGGVAASALIQSKEKFLLPARDTIEESAGAVNLRNTRAVCGRLARQVGYNRGTTSQGKR